MGQSQSFSSVYFTLVIIIIITIIVFICTCTKYTGLWHQWQYISVKDTTSSTRPLDTGVPQGSVLGSLLFLLYIKDLPSVSQQLASILFADDTTFVISHPNLTSLNTIVNVEFAKIATWLTVNKLTPNINRSFYIMFGSRTSEVQLNIILNNTLITKHNEGKFLGLHLDSNMTYNSHIQHITKKKFLKQLSSSQRYVTKYHKQHYLHYTIHWFTPTSPMLFVPGVPQRKIT